MILDTSFVTDIERELRRRRPAAAVRFLQARPQARTYLPFVVAGELACGKSMGDELAWVRFLNQFEFIDYSPAIGWRYGLLYKQLKSSGRLIGTNDLWIAAAALVHALPIVTRNAADYRRVPGLEVLTY